MAFPAFQTVTKSEMVAVDNCCWQYFFFAVTFLCVRGHSVHYLCFKLATSTFVLSVPDV